MFGLTLKKILVMVPVVMVVLFSQVQPALAWRGDRNHHSYYRHYDRHHYHHGNYGYRLSLLPFGAFAVMIGGARYYYHNGTYYDRVGSDYVVVNPSAPPVTYYRTLPETYQAVVIGGETYYTNGGNYYVYTRSGYQPVPAPIVYQQVVQSAPTVVTTTKDVSLPPPGASVAPTGVTATTTPMVSSPPDAVEGNSFIVNIPDSKGGFTAVTIKKYRTGYAGPQGEFYAEFPTVAQLKAMYVK